MTPLRRRMIDDMTLRNLSPHTVEAYVRAVAQFARHFGRSPEQLSGEDARGICCIWCRTGTRAGAATTLPAAGCSFSFA
jgi:hypothetical protein